MSCSLVQIIDPSECVGNSLSKINGNFTSLEKQVCGLLGSTNIPIGGIIMYSGSLGNFSGSRGISTTDVSAYGLCDGTLFGSIQSPDLRGRFIIGQSTVYTQLSTGGESTHTLTTDEIPSHAHVLPCGNGNGQNPGVSFNNGLGGYTFSTVPGTFGATGVANTDNDQSLFYSATTGGYLSHNNMPPWFALAYIIRVV